MMRMGMQPPVTGLRLLCKEPLVPLYEEAGFGLVGASSVVHGKDQWLEMALDVED